MAVTILTPSDPAIGAALADVPASTPQAFRPAINARKDSLHGNAQTIQARLEWLQSLLGNGWVSGGAISAGAGLSVSVASGAAVIGHYVAWDAAATVGGLTVSATNSIYLRQDGTWSSNTTGVAPTSSDGHGAALLWGTATTDASSVTGVGNSRAAFRALLPVAKTTIADMGALTSTVAATNPPTKVEFDALRSDLVAVYNKLAAVLDALQALGLV